MRPYFPADSRHHFYGIVAGAIYKATTTGQYSLVLTLPDSTSSKSLQRGVNDNLYGIFRVYGQAGSHLFSVSVDGSNFHKIADLPSSAVSNMRFVSASDGNLWGVSGNVVQISPSTGAVLQTFFFNGKNGSYPWSLIQAKDGTFAGTTAGGGTVSTGKHRFGFVRLGWPRRFNQVSGVRGTLARRPFIL